MLESCHACSMQRRNQACSWPILAKSRSHLDHAESTSCRRRASICLEICLRSMGVLSSALAARTPHVCRCQCWSAPRRGRVRRQATAWVTRSRATTCAPVMAAVVPARHATTALTSRLRSRLPARLAWAARAMQMPRVQHRHAPKARDRGWPAHSWATLSARDRSRERQHSWKSAKRLSSSARRCRCSQPLAAWHACNASRAAILQTMSAVQSNGGPKASPKSLPARIRHCLARSLVSWSWALAAKSLLDCSSNFSWCLASLAKPSQRWNNSLALASESAAASTSREAAAPKALRIRKDAALCSSTRSLRSLRSSRTAQAQADSPARAAAAALQRKERSLARWSTRRVSRWTMACWAAAARAARARPSSNARCSCRAASCRGRGRWALRAAAHALNSRPCARRKLRAARHLSSEAHRVLLEVRSSSACPSADVGRVPAMSPAHPTSASRSPNCMVARMSLRE
mmetsp:Transcript_114610/g.370315  ORF Transcript_114610/g.370315 Transcript_114610/m.370315 type:complete len:462 (-) Transcript_114610:926-2311(-)